MKKAGKRMVNLVWILVARRDDLEDCGVINYFTTSVGSVKPLHKYGNYLSRSQPSLPIE